MTVESQWLMFGKVYTVKVNSFWSQQKSNRMLCDNILLCLQNPPNQQTPSTLKHDLVYSIKHFISFSCVCNWRANRHFLVSNKVILFNSPFLVFPSASPLSVVPASVTDSPFSKMQFVDDRLVSADDSHTFTTAEVQLLVWCKGGAIHAVTTGRGTRSCTVQVTERWPEFYIFPYLTYASSFWNANETQFYCISQNTFTHYFLYL